MAKGSQMYDGALAKAANVQANPKYVNENTAAIITASIRREEYLRVFRIMDEQDAVNRYKWFNIPANLSSEEIERLLYYRGQLCFFYYEETDSFYFMPYALDGQIDFYGRYRSIHPVPFASGVDNPKNDKERALNKIVKNQTALLSQKVLMCRYDVMEEEDVNEDVALNSTVLLHDYCKQRGELIISRQILNEPILNSMADILSYFDTAVLVGSGVEGYRVENSAAKDEVKYLANSMYKSAINKTPYIPITGQIEFQELSTGSRKYAVNDFLMAFQGIDNLRLSTYGISNGGIYEKNAHVLEKEIEINNSNVYSPLQDGLKLRQRFCNIVNSIWGLDLWCEPSEAALKQDINGDGFDYDRENPEEEIENQEVSNNGDE